MVLQNKSTWGSLCCSAHNKTIALLPQLFLFRNKTSSLRKMMEWDFPHSTIYSPGVKTTKEAAAAFHFRSIQDKWRFGGQDSHWDWLCCPPRLEFRSSWCWFSDLRAGIYHCLLDFPLGIISTGGAARTEGLETTRLPEHSDLPPLCLKTSQKNLDWVFSLCFAQLIHHLLTVTTKDLHCAQSIFS